MTAERRQSCYSHIKLGTTHWILSVTQHSNAVHQSDLTQRYSIMFAKRNSNPRGLINNYQLLSLKYSSKMKRDNCS